MKRSLLAGLLSAPLAALSAPASADYLVREVGSFHIGGKQETLTGLPVREAVFTAGSAPRKVDPNGEFEVGQMYVQYVRLKKPRAKLPVLFWHGGGLSGVTWETKPDGKPGWHQSFLNAGYDTYVSDAVERGRASWARFPEIFKGEPLFRTKKEAWELFRFGPSYEVGGKREAFDGLKFPVSAFDQFAKQAVPRFVTTDALTQAAYDELVQKVCPCILVVHSQAGNFAFNAALKAPDKIKAIVALEPSGAPDPAKVDVSRVKAIPHLAIWGDYIDRSPPWQAYQKGSAAYLAALKSAGGRADTISLPEMGIRGNAHMLMMDTNSDQIAKIAQDWLTKNAGR